MPFRLNAAPLTAIASLTLVAGCAYNGAPMDEIGAEAVEWGYEGAGAPEYWGGLDPAWAACEYGTNQSPINLAGAQPADLPEPQFNYATRPMNIEHLGHTVQVNFGAGGSMMVGGTQYELLQFHFHTPAEHRLQGREYPAELHLVHRGPAGQLAVVGLLIKVGREDPTLARFWNQLPRVKGEERDLSALQLNLEELLPDDPDYYLYPGSLTTPPCTEGVTWMVMEDPIEMSAEQLTALRSLIGTTNRPIQPLGGRLLRLDVD